MMKYKVILCFCFLLNSISKLESEKITDEVAAKKYLEEADKQLEIAGERLTNAIWNFNTDINEANEAKMV